jgi:hypothetical protein
MRSQPEKPILPTLFFLTTQVDQLDSRLSPRPSSKRVSFLFFFLSPRKYHGFRHGPEGCDEKKSAAAAQPKSALPINDYHLNGLARLL